MRKRYLYCWNDMNVVVVGGGGGGVFICLLQWLDLGTWARRDLRWFERGVV